MKHSSYKFKPYLNIQKIIFQKMTKSIHDMIQNSKQRAESTIEQLCQRCYSLTTTKEEILRPYKVHKIMIPFQNFNTDPRLLQISNHLVEKPWRVLTQYVYITKATPYVSIYLVSPIYRRLGPYEEICHLTFIQPEEALCDLRGKPLVINIINLCQIKTI